MWQNKEPFLQSRMKIIDSTKDEPENWKILKLFVSAVNQQTKICWFEEPTQTNCYEKDHKKILFGNVKFWSRIKNVEKKTNDFFFEKVFENSSNRRSFLLRKKTVMFHLLSSFFIFACCKPKNFLLKDEIKFLKKCERQQFFSVL